MKVDAFGEVGKYVTEANEPILLEGERVIGFRQLEYRAYRAAFIAKVPLTDERGGWVWQTTKRVIHLDDKWEELQTGVRGKRVHEYSFEEARDIVWAGRSVRVTVSGKDIKAVFVYKPFGAAARLFNWLREQKEERKRFARGEVERLYEKEKPSG